MPSKDKASPFDADDGWEQGAVVPSQSSEDSSAPPVPAKDYYGMLNTEQNDTYPGQQLPHDAAQSRSYSNQQDIFPGRYDSDEEVGGGDSDSGPPPPVPAKNFNSYPERNTQNNDGRDDDDDEGPPPPIPAKNFRSGNYPDGGLGGGGNDDDDDDGPPPPIPAKTFETHTSHSSMYAQSQPGRYDSSDDEGPPPPIPAKSFNDNIQQQQQQADPYASYDLSYLDGKKEAEINEGDGNDDSGLKAQQIAGGGAAVGAAAASAVISDDEGKSGKKGKKSKKSKGKEKDGEGKQDKKDKSKSKIKKDGDGSKDDKVEILWICFIYLLLVLNFTK